MSNSKPPPKSPPKSLYEKIWGSHLVDEDDAGNCLIYVDRHLIHEVTSPQAFAGLRDSRRSVRRPDLALAVADHNVPTTDRSQGISDRDSRLQVEALTANAKKHGIQHFGMDDLRQGIVHVVGPEQGMTLPGNVIVCGDSHTATHGAFGALAFGIGTSEVEHVLATQTLPQRRSKTLRITLTNTLGRGVSAKDLVLAMIGQIGVAGAVGYVIEYTGSAMEALSMEGRMTVCNMSIEAGGRAGLIAPDEKTYAYLKDRPMAPKGTAWDAAVAWWKSLPSDTDARFDHEIEIDAADVSPMVTWGTTPEDLVAVDGKVPSPSDFADAGKRRQVERALNYMGLEPNRRIQDIRIDKSFIGSCTNGRIEDLREAATIAHGRKVADHVQALVVPGSGLVKQQAETEGLDRIFLDAGFEWREPGCSMCLAMNADRLEEGERCASTSNRNFEGRQGRGGRTHLMSPAMAAAAAIFGHITDARKLDS